MTYLKLKYWQDGTIYLTETEKSLPEPGFEPRFPAGNSGVNTGQYTTLNLNLCVYIIPWFSELVPLSVQI